MPVIPTTSERQLDGDQGGTARPIQPTPTPSTDDPVTFLLYNLDLTSLADHLRCAMPRAQLDPLIVEYRRFLVLKYTQRDFSETQSTSVWCPPVLRIIWAAHVLHTHSYRAMCEAIGEWIHHEPVSSIQDNMRLRSGLLRRRISATLVCYKNHFDTDPPHAIWSQAADPGSTSEDVDESPSVSSTGVPGSATADDPSSSATPPVQAVIQQAVPAVTAYEHADTLRIFVTPVSSYTDASTGFTLRSDTIIRRSFVFPVRPSTQFCKVTKAIAAHIGCSEDELVCIKTSVVGPQDASQDAWTSALVMQGEKLLRLSDPEWVGMSVGDIGLVNDEHVLVLCVKDEVHVVER